MGEEQVVLVVGACCLDRLLTVARYPAADAKIRTSSYHEIGGGNAANTAVTIARLNDAEFLKDKRIRVKYLGKVGQDTVGQRLLEELEASRVDTSSPLCLRGAVGSTTSFTTIIVSQQEHTRTCFHTPGSCGQLELGDCGGIDLDSVFENVVHLHSDTRHIEVSLYLAKEARKRQITVSCDCEKDRQSPALEELLNVSDVVFTNSGYLGAYLSRLTTEQEELHRVQSLPSPTIHHDNSLHETEQNILVNSLIPISFLSRWYPRLLRQVVVTQGRLGALHFTNVNLEDEVESGNKIIASSTIHVTNSSNSQDVIKVTHQLSHRPLYPSSTAALMKRYTYHVQTSGVLRNVNVVDTTGAGDAFIGGYLLAYITSVKSNKNGISFNMRFASWVSGKKLESPGVRDALPTGELVDQQLGRTVEDIDNSLDQVISGFSEI